MRGGTRDEVRKARRLLGTARRSRTQACCPKPSVHHQLSVLAETAETDFTFTLAPTDFMAETTLYLVRHGETDYNARSIVQGRRIDAVLNATGRAQAERLAGRFEDLPLDAVYTSTMRRAIETGAAVAARHLGVPVTALEDLEEMSWGVLEGEPPSDYVRDTFGRIFARWDAGDFDARLDEGESIVEVEARARRAFEAIVAAHAGETVLVVAHGRLLRVLLASVLPDYGLARMHMIHHANTSVNRVLVDADGPRADLLNCTAHLEGAVTDTLVE